MVLVQVVSIYSHVRVRIFSPAAIAQYSLTAVYRRLVRIMRHVTRVLADTRVAAAKATPVRTVKPSSIIAGEPEVHLTNA